MASPTRGADSLSHPKPFHILLIIKHKKTYYTAFTDIKLFTIYQKTFKGTKKIGQRTPVCNQPQEFLVTHPDNLHYQNQLKLNYFITFPFLESIQGRIKRYLM